MPTHRPQPFGLKLQMDPDSGDSGRGKGAQPTCQRGRPGRLPALDPGALSPWAQPTRGDPRLPRSPGDVSPARSAPTRQGLHSDATDVRRRPPSHPFLPEAGAKKERSSGEAVTRSAPR